MARTIVWSNPSLQDLGELREYIAQGSPQNAKNFLQNLRKTAENLVDFPQLGRIVPEFEDASIRERRGTTSAPHAPQGPHQTAVEPALMPNETIEINESGILHSRPNGSQNLLLHHELQAVEMLNADQVYFLLIGPNSSVVVPHDAVGADLLLKHLQKLPGFNNEMVITAMSTEGKFLCWKRPS